ERGPGHVFHHEIAASRFHYRVEDLDDVRVRELAGKRRLGNERLVLHALLLAVGVLVEQEYLDGDVALGERVAREVHLAGRTGTDLAEQRILADVLLELELHEPDVIASRVPRSAAGAPTPRRACRGTRLRRARQRAR